MLPLNFVLCTFKNRKKHFFVTHTFISRLKNKLKLKKKNKPKTKREKSVTQERGHLFCIQVGVCLF